MEMKPSLNLSLRPALIMTPRLQQALKLLQVPTLELQQILKQEIMQNPLLEEVDELTDNEDLAQGGLARGEGQRGGRGSRAKRIRSTGRTTCRTVLDRTYVPQSETSVEFLEKVPVTRTHAGREPARAAPLPEPAGRLHERSPSSWSARSTTAAGSRRRSRMSPRPRAVPSRTCEKVLKVIQALEPAGVGARNLRECLLIQLEARGEQDTLAWRIIHDHFDHLVNRRFPEIARQLKCAVEEVQAAADVIATLQPAPGAPGVERGSQVRRARPAGGAGRRGVRRRCSTTGTCRGCGSRRPTRACCAKRARPTRARTSRRPASTSRASSTPRAG